MTVVYDAVVVGLGGVGSFALRGLARQQGCGGGKFLGLERFSIGHCHGSSHGKSRIYRQAYFEHANYVPWLKYSVEEFRRLEESSKVDLMVECGTLIMEPASNVVRESATAGGTAKYSNVCQASYEAGIKYGIPVEKLGCSELKERFPQFNYSHDMIGVYEPGGGFVRPEQVIRAAIQEAQQASSVEIYEHAVVSSWKYLGQETKPAKTSSQNSPSLIELQVKLQNPPPNDTGRGGNHTERGGGGQHEPEHIIAVTTRCLLIAAGAWTGQLVPSWSPYLVPHRQLQGWVEETNTNTNTNPSIFDSSRMPGWVMITPDYPLPLYGVPADSSSLSSRDDQRRIKIGIHGRMDPIYDFARHTPTATDAEVQELTRASHAALHHQPTTDDDDDAHSMVLKRLEPCIYTMTPDAHFMIGSPHPNVFAIAGLSGHGFKQTPALGQMMVDFCFAGIHSVEQKWKFEFCSPSRFGILSSSSSHGMT